MKLKWIYRWLIGQTGCGEKKWYRKPIYLKKNGKVIYLAWPFCNIVAPLITVAIFVFGGGLCAWSLNKQRGMRK